MLRRWFALTTLLCLPFVASAQLPKPFYAWWSNPVVVRDLNLKPAQKREIREAVVGYREHLVYLRGEIERAENDLELQFNQQPVDARKTNEAIERLAGARGELTRTLSQMSLKLRMVLTQEQWQDLQRRRPGKAPLAVPTENEPR